MTLTVRRADPAGNITLFVLSAVEKGRRAAVAKALMERREFAAEQVAFVLPPREGGAGRFEMMGGEFCGNATRAFGLLLCRERGDMGPTRLFVEAGGAPGLTAVEADATAHWARAAMPLPRSLRRAAAGAAVGTLVDLGGIVHFVVEREPDETVLRAAEPILGAYPAAAYGVIFLHGGRLTPLVKVPATGTLVWEGSCGSGALAAAAAQSAGQNGAFARDYVQPAGTVRAELLWRSGRAVSAAISGSVTLDGPVTVTL